MNNQTSDLSGFLLGTSILMTELRATIARFARTRIPILVKGPSGSGKELVARAIHVSSARRGDLVAVNTCAISETMFEDTLFGHVKGAFTGATQDAPGLLAEANGGTLFLDEISGLLLASQVKLLRAIELGTYRPVGGARDRTSEFRVVAASNEDLLALVAAGRFRADLLHRLGGVVVTVPSLLEHPDDIPELVRHFVRELSGREDCIITDAAFLKLAEHTWPGNVRELRHTIERALVLSGTRITRESVSAALHGGASSASPERQDGFARSRLLRLLEECSWDTDSAAVSLGVHRATIYRRMERLGIQPRAREGLLGAREDRQGERAIELA